MGDVRRIYILQPEDVRILKKWEDWIPQRFSAQTREDMIQNFWRNLSDRMQFVTGTERMIGEGPSFTAEPWKSVLEAEEAVRDWGQKALGQVIRSFPFSSLLEPMFDDMCSMLKRTIENEEICWDGFDVQGRKARVSYRRWYFDCSCCWPCDCISGWRHAVTVFVEDIACTACNRHGRSFQSKPIPGACSHCHRIFEIHEDDPCPLCGHMKFHETGMAGRCSICLQSLCQGCLVRRHVVADQDEHNPKAHVFREPRIVLVPPMELMSIPGLGDTRRALLKDMTLENFLDDAEWMKRVQANGYMRNRQAFLRGGMYATLVKGFRPSCPSPNLDYGLFRVEPVCLLELCLTCLGRCASPGELVNAAVGHIRELLAGRSDLMPSSPVPDFTPVPYDSCGRYG